MIKNIIFDLDGTLANTHEDIIDALQFSLKKKNLFKKISLKLFKRVANKGSYFMISKILKRKDKKICAEINNIFKKHYNNNLCKKSKLKKNILPFLKYCNKNQISLYVSTNKLEKNAKLLLKKLQIFNFFKFIIGHDTFNSKKPNPIQLEKLKSKFKFKKKETIFIGDSEVDSSLAKNFGIRFILIKKGYTNLDYKKIFAHYKVNDYSEVKLLLKNHIFA